MVRTMAPELKNYMDKKLHLQLNGNRTVIGVLRGYDAFMNVHLADAFEVLSEEDHSPLGVAVIRGNSIVSMEALEPIED
ncbi:hypothetical protein GGF37_005713 [Kickxella alabastrina]|uniref:Uncharacterized protein n=2 Tax=Kickxella alabastrina TaxID=61397 RepID=A0ACC1I758_9FUNG|nr:hypothetical protein LPJ66_009102 [Kickxella alabastrina]KAJ1889041.1 hypothetical protein LPJ66_008250 [Kickxella alabastrina]KAJ1936175.1 hypothetical protein GGF37_005713 [Kickxella alabastrina]